MKLTPEQQARIDKAHDEAQTRISEAFTEGMIDLFSMFGSKPERWSCTEDQDLANFTAEIEKLISDATGTAPELPTVLNPENVASTDIPVCDECDGMSNGPWTPGACPKCLGSGRTDIPRIRIINNTEGGE